MLNWYSSTYLYICDYDIQKKEGIHIFNLLDLQYDPTKMTPIAFYNQYRTMITNNLSRKDDIIKYKNNHKLAQDERMSPMLENLLLLDAVREIETSSYQKFLHPQAVQDGQTHGL